MNQKFDLEEELAKILREEIDKEFIKSINTGKGLVSAKPTPKENWCFGIYHYMEDGEHWFRIRGQGDVYDECCRDLRQYKIADTWDDWPWFGIKFASDDDRRTWEDKWRKDIMEDDEEYEDGTE